MFRNAGRHLAARFGRARSTGAEGRGAVDAAEASAALAVLAPKVRQHLDALTGSIEMAGSGGGATQFSDRQIIEGSGLFDHRWYLRRYPDLGEAGVEPLGHFMEQGFREGRWPNSEFDTSYYMAKVGEEALAGRNPLAHYITRGEAEGRKPNAFFEPAFYAQTYADELRGSSPLAHYLKVAEGGTHAPNPFFDPRFYKLQNPDVSAAGADPVLHFREQGWKEGRDPSERFNVRYYLQRYLPGEQSVDPVTLHLEVGLAEGRATKPTERAPTPANEIRRFTARGPSFEPNQKPIAAKAAVKAKAVAFYLPQFHTFPENDAWWGAGFTEWTNLPRGTPRFLGHYQPRIPRDFGCYDLNDPSVLPRQVDAARKAGIHGFCYYYYSFNRRRLLDMPLEQLLARPEIDFPFSLMWANENWSRRWDGSEKEILIAQDYSPEDEPALIADLVRHFRDPRYIRIDGRPLFSIYRVSLIPKAKQTIARWREMFLELGEDPLIVMAQGFNSHDPRLFGLDGAVEFPPHKLVNDIQPIERGLEVLDPDFSARVYEYGDLVKSAAAVESLPFPLIRTVAPSWDNDARRQGHGLVLANSTPDLFARWVEDSVAFAKKNPFHGETMIFVNAWNEWAEGAYLEPDLHYGHAYLNAFARAITGQTRIDGKRKVLLLGHDAFPAGSQMLLLNIGRTLSCQFGCEVTYVLGAGGELLERYREIAPTILAEDEAQFDRAAHDLKRQGYALCIANTVASGGWLPRLKDLEFRVVSLVHELPGIIREKGLEAEAEAVIENADFCVFATRHIRDGLADFGQMSGEAVVRPQGLYTPPAYDLAAYAKVRRELKLPKGSKIVLNVGYADLRKGVDLFAAAARVVAKTRPDVHFVWAGAHDPAVHAWLVASNDCPNLHFLGIRDDIGNLLSAADLFLLTSREDPFPTVVMEALSCGVRVLGFEGAGGFVELLEDPRLGALVPFGDVEAIAANVLKELERVGRAALPEWTAEIRARFAFDEYAFDLLRLLDPDLKKVSVVIPNYNYAQYLAGRLESVVDQSYPIFEIIVLDDASKDESLEVLAEFIRARGRSVRTVPNQRNSGGAFRQWKKGAELARGDYVWIAEADDEASPVLIERLIGSAGPNLTFAFCDSSAMDSEGEELWPDHKAYFSKIFSGALKEDLNAVPASEFARTYLAQRNAIVNVSSVLWSRKSLIDAFEKVGKALFDHRFAGDWRLYLEACAAGGTVTYIGEPLNRHRRHDKGLTQSSTVSDQIAEIGRIHSAYAVLFPTDITANLAQAVYLKELLAQFDKKGSEIPMLGPPGTRRVKRRRR